MLAITHDIKAPLGSVMGYIDLLSRLTSDKRQELYLQNMKSSSEHLLALVNSLLDFYRLDANKMEVDAVAFNPAQLFETIRAGFAAARPPKDWNCGWSSPRARTAKWRAMPSGSGRSPTTCFPTP